MVIGEALGESEELAGVGFVGKSGHFLFNNLQRVGIDRDTLTIFNVVACRPPDNKLVGTSYEAACVAHCKPNLDGEIAKARDIAKANGKTFTIVTLGKTAFTRILNIDIKNPLLKEDYYCYPFWSEDYQAWVLAAAHPSYLMRGKHHEVPVLQFAFRRALEIANGGLVINRPPYLLDPEPMVFSGWVDDYLSALVADPLNTFLSYDIETPYKTGKGEDDLAKEDDDETYTILRCAFSYRPGESVSVPWTAPYLADLSRLFASDGPKVGWNNELYDGPRVSAQVTLNGDQIDAMLAWHVLNSALDKRLGFVTPFYVQTTSMWKHLSNSEPAFYNAKDADMALQNWLGIRDDLKSNGLWKVFDRHIIDLNRIYSYMSRKGVLLDLTLRQEAETKLSAELAEMETAIANAVPLEVLQLKPYAKPPKDLTGLVEINGVRKTTKCPVCSTLDVKAAHYKSIGKKKLAKGEPENPCLDNKSIKVTLPAKQWALPLPFKLSNQALQRYQRVMKHQPIMTRAKGPVKPRPTYDDKAITKLIIKYPNDKLYPLVGDFRAVQKLLGTYVGITQENGRIKGGMPTGKDGRIHPTLSHNPATLRSACQDPNMQNLPRPNTADPAANENLIRNMIMAAPGHILYARDFSGIEAKIVGYEAMYPEYIRLCNLDVHSFYTAWALSQIKPGSIPTNDLPLLGWDDAKLGQRLKEIKKEFGRERNNLYKHLVHGANFMQGAKGATDTILRMTGQVVPVQTVSRVMQIYFELFPKIKRWHGLVLAQADKDGFLRNPFGYVHRFHSVYSWELFGKDWQKQPGPQANQVVAFLPQSTAAGIIKESMLRLWNDHRESAGQFLRLLVHDELFFEVPDDKWETLDAVCKTEMERPIKEMKMPADWNMGEYFVVSTEEKKGLRWGSMK
jgi:uracil-DNA glycosylase family 4